MRQKLSRKRSQIVKATIKSLASFLLFAMVLSYAPGAYADSLNLTISGNGNASLNIAPMDLVGTFASSDIANVTVSTDFTNGYTLGIRATTSTELVGSESSFSSISEPISGANFSAIANTNLNNKWGYKPSKFESDANTNYLPSPSLAGNVLDVTYSANSTANTYTITLGARANMNTKPGAYTNTFVITAVANVRQCPANTICYDGNNTNAVGSMPDQTVTSNSTATLIASNYSLVNHGFAGWSTNRDAVPGDGVSTIYGPNANYATGDLSAGGINLYAIWVPKSTQYTMQTFTASACNAMSDGDIVALEDTRDGQVYAITKIHKNVGESNEYGECWMAENLRLDVKNANITASNTNHPTTSFLTERISGTWQTCSANSAACDDQVSFSLVNLDRSKTASYNTNNQNSSWYSYGGMYNWYTATAGRGTYSQSSGRAGGDICPSGWHMPTGGSSNTTNDFYNLNVALNNNTNVTNSDAKLRGYPANFVYSGSYYGSSANNRGSSGYYWSSTAGNNNYGYSLYFSSSGVGPGTNSSNKYYGQAVRCLANVSEESFTLTYNANGGSGAPASQNGTSASRSYTFTLSSSTPTYSGLNFAGWARSSTAAEAEYQLGETIEITQPGTTTLYAVWKPNVTIVFNASGGTGTMANMAVPSGKSKTLTSNGFSKSGYTFAGWTTTQGGTTVEYANSASYTAPTVTQDTTVTLYAVWGRSRTISYNGNNADSGTMTNTHSTSEYASVELYAPNFYRTNYGFAGWSETQVDPTASNALTTINSLASQGKIYGPNETITVPAYTGSTSAMTLYAVWVPKDTTYNLQTFASANRCSTMSEGDIIALQDSRDSNVYTVAKLKDGNCWMTENLRLDPSDSNTSITASNTNNPTSTFINTDIVLSNITDKTGKKAYTNNYFRTCADTNSTNGPTCMDQISFGLGNLTGTNSIYYSALANQTYRWYAYGIMYNWYTATAGNGTYSNGSGVVANGDICPSGWHLPYGGSGTGTKGGNTDGGFYYLNYKLNNNSNVTNGTASNLLRAYPNNFVYSGYYVGSSAYARGSFGYYWSSTAYDNGSGYYLYFASSYVNPGMDYNYKYYGRAVRCLAD